jgi:Zn-dependent protease
MLLFNLISNPIYFIAFIVALLIGITVHEYAHAWMALRCGDPTAKVEGRLSLNPLAHLDPIGTLFLVVVGFGWGKPVPVNPNYFQKKQDELKVAIAGIVTNIIVALILAIPIRIALLQGHAIDSSAILTFLNIVVDVNLVLAAFNIIPIFPLDGSHFIEYFLEGNARSAYQSFGPYLLFGLILLSRFTGFNLLFTIMEPLLRLLSFMVKGTFSTFL